MNSSEPYTSAVSISVIPSERPVRSASSSSACGCLPFPSPAEPWPNAGMTVPSRNFTVRPAPGEAASRADAPVANELSATQSPLNSRRFSSLVSLLEPISKSPEEDNEASELYEAEEVVGVVFPTDEDAALPLNPSKEALHEPTSHIAA